MARTVIRTLIAAIVAAGVFAGNFWLMGLEGCGDDVALWASLATILWALAAGTWAATSPNPSASDLFYAPTSTAEPADLRWRSDHDG